MRTTYTKILFWILIFLGYPMFTEGQTCTTIASGDFADAANWSCTGTTAPPSLSGSDTIIIQHAMTSSTSITISGSTTITIDSLASWSVTGTVYTSSNTVTLNIHGTMESTGSFTAEGGAINVHNGGQLNVTGAGSDYIITKGAGGKGATSVTTLYDGASMNVNNAITWNAGISTLVQYAGSTINASSMSIQGGSTDPAVVLGGTVNISGPITTNSAARTIDISGTVNALSFTTQQATVSLTGTMNLTEDFSSTGTSFVDFTGTINARDMLISGSGNISGTPTLNLRDLRFGWSNWTGSPYTNTLNFSGTANLTGGTVNLSRNLTSNGSTTVTIAADVTVGGDVYVGAGNGIVFNAPATVAGNMNKVGASPITINANVTVAGTTDITGGGAVTVASGVTWRTRHLYATGNNIVTVDGTLDIDSTLRLGVTADSVLTGSASIVGSGVVGWLTYATNNNTSSTYIGCVGHAADYLRYDAFEVNSLPYPPENPLDLTTCGPGTILPVTFISFQGIAEGGTVILTWATATEKDNQEFIIEHSDGSDDFYPVGSVEGSGTSQSINSYSFSYTGAGGYFRLKQVDFDGQFDYSAVIYVEDTPAEELKVFPNPLDGNSFQVQLNQELEGAATILVSNLTGTVFIRQELDPSVYFAEIKRSHGMVPGLYLVEVRTANKVLYERLVVK